MLLQISNVLGPDAVDQIRAALNSTGTAFVSGKATAGWYAKDIKHNDQATSESTAAIIEEIRRALLGHAVFVSAARPKSFVKTLISRYRPGMHYGTHVDDALIGGVRTDMSFTLFIAEPDSYDGGELVIEGHDGETEIKLPAGGLVLYPTTSLHRVNEVTRGERLACVGWVRSFIRNAEQRETLFDLDQVVARMNHAGTDRGEMNPIIKVRNSLTRMWAED